MAYKFLEKTTSFSAVKSEVMPNQQLAEKLHNPFIRNIEKRKVRSSFIDRFRFLLCFIGIYSKHTWLIPLKDKKSITISNAFLKILGKSNCKPNKVWVDKGSEFYNRLTKSWLRDNDIEMSSTHNKGKSVVAERFIRTLKNKT